MRLETGDRERLRILEAIDERDALISDDPTLIKFKCATDDGMIDEIMTYNEILEKVEDHDDEAGESRFSSIDDHYGPLKKGDVEYKGSTWNVRVNWEGSEPTYEPLKLIAECDPVTCAIYAKKNGLLNLPGWKQFKNLASKQKKIIRLINQTKLQSNNQSPTHNYCNAKSAHGDNWQTR